MKQIKKKESPIERKGEMTQAQRKELIAYVTKRTNSKEGFILLIAGKKDTKLRTSKQNFSGSEHINILMNAIHAFTNDNPVKKALVGMMILKSLQQE